MNNYLPKNPFYICSKKSLLGLLFILSLNFVFGQAKINIHFVSTDDKAIISPEQKIEIQQFGRAVNVQVEVDQTLHPQKGSLSPVNYNDTMPYYSAEMRKIRDAYLNRSKSKTNKDYYVFLTRNKQKASRSGFALPGKHVLFVDMPDKKTFIKEFSGFFLVAAADQAGSTRKGLDSLSKLIGYSDSIKIETDPFYLFHDDTEQMGSKNGMVAYAFIEMDKGQNIKENEISLPFKRNSGKLNLDVDSYWLKPFYSFNHRYIAPIHVSLVLLTFIIMLFFRKRIKNKAEQTVKIQSKLGYFLLRLALWLIFFGIGFAVFLTTDRFYKEMFFNSANYKALGPLSKKDFIKHLTTSKTIVDNDAKKPYWEVYTLTDKHWEMKHYKMVLYFKVTIDEAGNPIQTKFLYDSDQIKIKGYKKKVRTHLIVKQYFRNAKCVKEEVYNYANSKITKKFSSKDPALKILLFVNGYRPVANGGTPEQALMQIGNNGIEFPNSANVLYDADRFNYWRPWGNFDQRIIDRIKPNEVYYADGHHTVATSNHGSVIKFAKAAAEFPKPCKGNHHCEFAETATGTKMKTLSMLPFKANKSGFKQRRKNGAIAGFNLYQLLNEVPGASNNDTVFIVAHSMGYAYSLGMVDALRGKCNLGTYYIFCPENAESGKVIESEWLEVYQYGAIAKGPLKQAPCLQDGVAPQTKAAGLSSKNRLTFPKEYEKKMGFTGSHFIGFYDWVFNIPAGQPGAIRQR